MADDAGSRLVACNLHHRYCLKPSSASSHQYKSMQRRTHQLLLNTGGSCKGRCSICQAHTALAGIAVVQAELVCVGDLIGTCPGCKAELCQSGFKPPHCLLPRRRAKSKRSDKHEPGQLRASAASQIAIACTRIIARGFCQIFCSSD